MNEELQYYLCRVANTGGVIMVGHGDYRFLRNHEERLRVPDPDGALVLLAQGTKREVSAYYDLINGGNITNVS